MRERVGRGRGGGKYERVVVGYEAGLGDVGRDGGLASGVPRERLTRRWDEMALWQWPGRIGAGAGLMVRDLMCWGFS